MTDLAPPPDAAGARLVFLFLQVPASALMPRVADLLEARGHRVVKVHICAGDACVWGWRKATSFRGRARDWPGFVGALARREGVTDLVLLGEERPYHKAAIQATAPLGVRVATVDMGYLRPDWITLERDGSGTNSRFPRDPGAIRDAARDLPEPDLAVRYRHGFAVEAFYDLLYNLPNATLPFLYPHYRGHGLFHPLHEYAGWIGRLLKRGRAERAARALAARMVGEITPVHVLPLQLETDFQVRAHSPFASQSEAIERVTGAFAAAAPPGSRLLVKIHPLDNGLVDWRGIARRAARANGVESRVEVVEGGDLSAMIARARGVVTINSTVGLQALRQGKPVHLLGTAVYGIEGLVDARPLEAFFAAPVPPDPDLVAAFVRLLAATIQIRGDYYDGQGLAAAAEAIAGRLGSQGVGRAVAD